MNSGKDETFALSKERTAPESPYCLVNAYDEPVRTRVGEMMKRTDMCQCEKCFLDVCAIVLNRRYSHFVTTKKGEILAKAPEMNQCSQAEMAVDIMDAIRIVKSFPRH